VRNTRRARAAALLPVALTLAACGGGAVDEAQSLASRSGPPLYFLGDAFEGLPLTEVEELGLFVYGECNGEGSGDTFHCSAPQVQLQHYPLERRHPAMFDASMRAPCGRGVVRGRMIAVFATTGGLEVYIGRRVVVVFGDSPERTLRAAGALRALRGPSEAEPPASVARELATCTLTPHAALARG
jgi:hypothetical protein